MPLVRWIIVGLLVLPVAEIIAFIVVAMITGVLWALALMIATSVAGIMLLRGHGVGHVTRVRGAVAQDGFAALSLDTPGIAAVAGAFLLLIPGFITDCLGIVLLAPPIRRWLFAAAAGARQRRSAGPKSGPNGGPRRGSKTLDLDPAEWRRDSGPTLPRRPLGENRERT